MSKQATPFKTPLPILQAIEQCRLKQKKRLDLSGDSYYFPKFLLPLLLPCVPPEIFSLTHLEKLDLSDHAIQVLPEEIKQIKHLKSIDLRYNPLRQVADVFGLILHYADFKKVNVLLENIIGLKLTLFSYDAPEGIFDFPQLTTLEIKNHRLKQFPDWIFQLKNLTSLDLSDNQLTSLAGLEELENLTSLNLDNNLSLTSLPEQLFTLRGTWYR
jgi:hypothetical protein